MDLPEATQGHERDAQDDVVGIGILLVSPDNALIPYSFSLTIGCSNNMAEYKAVVVGLELTLEIPITSLTIYSNSELIVKQLREE